jgi:FtsZ-binding cell division protein ZapB/opacity protein-like surface antigen
MQIKRPLVIACHEPAFQSIFKLEMRAPSRILRLGILLGACFLGVTSRLAAQDTDNLKKEIDELREQNRLLQQQLQQQREMIDQLSAKVSGLQQTNEQSQTDLRALKASVENPPVTPEKPKGFSLGNVVIGGEGGVGIFDTQSAGKYPNAALLVDEARLFLDAPVWHDVYFYGEVDLQTREQFDAGVYLGEVYLQAENLGQLWNNDEMLNARLGQFYIPFGEEYEYRFAIDNALISHSLSDIWGLSPGLELYGSFKPLSYVIAVQDGGSSTLNDFTADKSVAGRIGYDPERWLHFSLSGMRTGHLSVANDGISATWFGGSFFTPLSPKATIFQANLAEADATAKWKGGYVRLAGGYAGYDDNNPMGGDHRDIYYYYAEGLQHLTSKFYAAARWSQIRVPGAYPIMADSPLFPGLSTSDIWRLSLGLGYHFSDHLVLKVEYAFEQGRLSAGGNRNGENLFAAEAAFRF